MSVPGFWNSHTGSGRGYGWLRLKILLPEKCPPLGIYIHHALMAFTLYVNGDEVLRNGTTGNSASDHVPGRIPVYNALRTEKELILALTILYSVYKAFRAGRSGSRINLPGLIILFACLIYDLVVSIFQLPLKLSLVHIGFALFIFMQTIFLLFRFSEAKRMADYLTRHLRTEINAKTEELRKRNT